MTQGKLSPGKLSPGQVTPATVSPAKGVAPTSNVRELVVLARRNLTGEPPKRSAASL